MVFSVTLTRSRKNFIILVLKFLIMSVLGNNVCVLGGPEILYSLTFNNSEF